jgi:hypothetical protein
LDVLDTLRLALADRYAIERELGHVPGLDRFLREIRTTAQLTRLNILPLLDSGEAEGFFFLSARPERNESPLVCGGL